MLLDIYMYVGVGSAWLTADAIYIYMVLGDIMVISSWLTADAIVKDLYVALVDIRAWLKADAFIC